MNLTIKILIQVAPRHYRSVMLTYARQIDRNRANRQLVNEALLQAKSIFDTIEEDNTIKERYCPARFLISVGC